MYKYSSKSQFTANVLNLISTDQDNYSVESLADYFHDCVNDVIIYEQESKFYYIVLESMEYDTLEYFHLNYDYQALAKLSVD